MIEEKKSKCKAAGRNKRKCKIYQDSKRRERNKMRKLKKRLRTHPNDTCITVALARIKREHGIA